MFQAYACIAIDLESRRAEQQALTIAKKIDSEILFNKTIEKMADQMINGSSHLDFRRAVWFVKEQTGNTNTFLAKMAIKNLEEIGLRAGKEIISEISEKDVRKMAFAALVIVISF